MTRFQEYWRSLKTTRPDEYKLRLEKNRERARAYRKMIQDDPEKRKQMNAYRRQKYKESKTNQT